MPYCCYLLTPKETKKNMKISYVGFTVDPRRRIRQHNGELKCGGARRTKRHRPWEFVVVVIGFPTKFTALSFEFVWQHTLRSRLFLRDNNTLTPRRAGGKYSIKRKLLELAVMVTEIPCFNKFALILNFQNDKFARIFNTVRQENGVFNLPVHTKVVSKPVDQVFETDLKQYSLSKKLPDVRSLNCCCCRMGFEKPRAVIQCTNQSNCDAVFHPVCIARHLLQAEKHSNKVLPIAGSCPRCCIYLCWAELVCRTMDAWCVKDKRLRSLETRPLKKASTCSLEDVETLNDLNCNKQVKNNLSPRVESDRELEEDMDEDNVDEEKCFIVSFDSDSDESIRSGGLSDQLEMLSFHDNHEIEEIY